MRYRNLPILILALVAVAPLGLLAESAAELIRRGDALDAELKSREALEVYLKAESLKPDDPELLIKIAKQYGDLINDAPNRAQEKASGQKSLEYAQRALALDPNLADANLSMALCYAKLTPYMGNKEKVKSSKLIRDYAQKAVDLNPKSDYAHHMLGRWNQEMAAMGDIQKGLAKLFYGGLPEASFEKALEELDIARQLRPDRLLHQVEYGRTLLLMGRKEEGIRQLKKGLAMPNTEKDDPETKLRGQRTLEQFD